MTDQNMEEDSDQDHLGIVVPPRPSLLATSFGTPLSSGLPSVRRPTPRPGTGSTTSPSPGRGGTTSTRITKEQLIELLPQTANIRNICILAHVDHGKTTLSDSLIAANGIISSKQAGQLRYLDSREDEQQRGITMQSSGISLLYSVTSEDGEKPERQEGEIRKDYLINLIDSPGHIDFAGQVTTATRLCDGALLVVDVIEGICSQTLAVMRQARQHHLSSLVVILNKVDRLHGERKLTPVEASSHLHSLITALQDTSATLFAGYWQFTWRNIIFASALDGWAFGAVELCHFYFSTMKMKIEPAMWLGEEYTWDPKSKACVQRHGHQPSIFTKLAMEPIWQIYNLRLDSVNGDLEMQTQRMTQKLQIPPLSGRDLKDRRQTVRAIMSSWLPMAPCVFQACISNIPSPDEHLLTMSNVMQNLSLSNKEMDDSAKEKNGQKPLLVYISKLISVMERQRDVSDNTSPSELTSPTMKLIGMARCFQGKLSIGDQVYILLPKHSSKHPEQAIPFTVTSLYLLMGRESMFPVDEVFSGNVFGIGNLPEDVVYKTATLSSDPATTSLDYYFATSSSSSPSLGGDKVDTYTTNPPVVQVTLQPKHLTDFEALDRGLHKLTQSDPLAEHYVNPDSGEYVLGVCGELHLQQCLKDLRERFALVDFLVSGEPTVQYRETISQSNNETFSFVEEEEESEKISIAIDTYSEGDTNKLVITDREGRDMDDPQVQSAFSLAMQRGPLAAEPMTKVRATLQLSVDSVLTSSSYDRVLWIKECIQKCLQDAKPRLLVPMYACTVQCPQDFIGRVYGVLNKRHALIQGEQCLSTDSTTSGNNLLLQVECLLPVTESFGLAEDLRGKTSGMAFPQMTFAGYHPLTSSTITNVEEDDHDNIPIGDDESSPSSLPSLERRYIQQIRQRKGLFTGKKVMEASAEKQRTLMK